MLPFLHHNLQLLEQLLGRSSEVLAKFNRYDLDLFPAVTAFLDEATGLYVALNQASGQNELLSLKAQFVSAQSGIHPLTLVRVTERRREMVRSIALLVLQQSSQKLRADAERISQKLSDGRTQLRPITLVAMQKGLVPEHHPLNQDELEQLWRALLTEPDIGLAARQLAMELSPFDVELLLADLLDAAQPPGPAPAAVSQGWFEVEAQATESGAAKTAPADDEEARNLVGKEDLQWLAPR